MEYSDILSFIERSKAPLETLKYKRMRVEYYSDVFVSILKLVPSLRELHVIDAPVSYHTLKTLFPSESGPTSLLCPGLETLMCNCVIPGDPHIVKFIGSTRVPSVAYPLMLIIATRNKINHFYDRYILSLYIIRGLSICEEPPRIHLLLLS